MMSLLFHIELQTLTSAVGQENEVKSIQIGKKEVKIYLIVYKPCLSI